MKILCGEGLKLSIGPLNTQCVIPASGDSQLSSNKRRSFIHVIFSHIQRLSSSWYHLFFLVFVLKWQTGNKIKPAVALSKGSDFSRFEHFWKGLEMMQEGLSLNVRYNIGLAYLDVNVKI